MMKKIGAILLAIVMVLALGTATVAAESTEEHGTESTSNSFTIAKDIVLFNTTGGTQIYEPNVTYNFAITAGNPGTATITDDPAVKTYDGNTDKSVTVQVKAGTGGVTLTGTDSASKGVGEGNINVVFGDETHTDAAAYAHTTLAEGATVSKDTTAKATRTFTVTIDPTSNAFKKTVDGVTNFVPGVYRYHIADTTPADNISAAGIKRNANTLKDLTLDVYLRWSDNTRTALQVYGYVLFRGLTENESLTYNGTSGTATTAKVTGFDVPSNMEGDDHTDITSVADEYHTFNTTISKTVSGNLADKSNAFPFTIALTGIADSEFYYTRAGVGDGRAIAAAAGLQVMTSGSASISSNLKDGESITLVGLPYSTTVKATETNNTPDYYTPSATFKAGSANAAPLTGNDFVITDGFNPGKTAETAVFNNGKSASPKDLTEVLTEDVIAFTNTLAEISPTGVVLRVAPYVLILGAGIVLLLISRRRKDKAEEA